MYEWFLNDGTCLVGKEAEDYLIKKLSSFKKLSNEIDNVLSDCKSLNVIENGDSLDYSVMETGERLSTIQVLLETLLEEMSFKL